MSSFDEQIKHRRELLKTRDPLDQPEGWSTLKARGMPTPPLQKPYPVDATLVDLVDPDEFELGNVQVIQAIRERRCRFKFTDEMLSLEELSFLLWATQGVHSVDEDRNDTVRTVPAVGMRHLLETYVIVLNVDEVDSGVYRYLPLEHKLLYLKRIDLNLPDRLMVTTYWQDFAAKSAVVFVWTTIPYRTEWDYSMACHKDILLEAGHVCQNLYLACEGIGAGTCHIPTYDQRWMDSIVGVDGDEEFVVYLASVGKPDYENESN